LSYREPEFTDRHAPARSPDTAPFRSLFRCSQAVPALFFRAAALQELPPGVPGGALPRRRAAADELGLRSAGSRVTGVVSRVAGSCGAAVSELGGPAPASELADARPARGAGGPLTVEDSERAARRAVELIYPPRERKKALVVDLDGTLWHGVIGEDGPERIMHGPEGLGFPFHVFQKFLLKLKGEGVLLAF